MHEQKNAIRYLVELLGTIALYTVVLVVSIKVGYPMRFGLGRTLVLISPMAPFLLTVVAVIRQLRRVDEYQRWLALENFAIAAGVTAGWTFTCGFLEMAGYPRLSMFTVWPVMAAVLVVLAITRIVAGR